MGACVTVEGILLSFTVRPGSATAIGMTDKAIESMSIDMMSVDIVFLFSSYIFTFTFFLFFL
jgi:hypothetical protein